MSSACASGSFAQRHRSRRAWCILLVWLLAASTAPAQPPIPGFTARLVDLNKRLDDGVAWTDAVLNGRRISYRDVQLDIVDTIEAVNLGRTIEDRIPDPADPETDIFIRHNGKFLEVPLNEERPWASNPDLPYPGGTFFPGGDGQDFGVLIEAEVTIPVGRWQIAFGSDAGGWVQLVDPRLADPPTSEDPPPNPVGFYRRVNDDEPLSTGMFEMFDSAVWYNSPRGFGWTGATFDTRAHDQPVTTRLRAFSYETDLNDGFEIVIRDTDDGLVALPHHIGPNNTLLPEDHDWRLLRDGEYEWQVHAVPVETGGVLSGSRLEFPVMHVAGRGVLGPAHHAGELIDDEEDPDDLVLGTPREVPGLVQLRRYHIPGIFGFASVEDAREFIHDREEPENEHKEPIAQGFVDRIAWRSGDFYPPALGFPSVRADLLNSPNEYGVRIEGELLVPESLASLPRNQRVIRFKDANDSFAGFVLDLDGDGDIDERDNMDNLLEVVIDDTSPAFGLDGRGSPISEALISGPLATEEDRWRKFEFYMSKIGLLTDGALLAWDQNVSDDPSVPVPPFPTTPFDPLSPEHVIGPEHFRSFATPILEGELVLDVGEMANTLIFEVNVNEEKWDSIGIDDDLVPDFVIASPSSFQRTLEFGESTIVVDIVEGTPENGFTIDLVDETVNTIQIQGMDAIEWADAESDEWQDSFVFTYGRDDEWDLSEFLLNGIIRFGSTFMPPDGDYNRNGLVEQQDLDLVLANWGDSFATLPQEWVHQRPTEGVVDQEELDAVLVNWGNSSPIAARAAAVPEPSTALLAALLAIVFALRRALRRIAVVAAIGALCGTSVASAQTTATGFTGRLLDVSMDVNEHAEGLAFLRGIGIDSTAVQADVFDLVSVADFGGSLRGDFFVDDGEEPEERGAPYPGGQYSPGPDGQDFVVSLEANVTIPPGTWQIAFGTGDGGTVQIDGVHFSQRYNDVDRMVGAFFGMSHDALIHDNNRGLNAAGEDRGWTGGTFRVTGRDPVTTRLVHTFHQTPHRFDNNHLSELIIRDASGGEITDIGQDTFDPTTNEWELLTHSAHGWEVRPTSHHAGPSVDPIAIGPVEHLGGRGLLGSVLRGDTMPETEVVRLVDEREGMLLARRYSIPAFDEDLDSIEEIEAWIADQDDNGGPDHVGYISHVQWESRNYYPPGLGFDEPAGDEDNYLVKLTGQLYIPQTGLDGERQKVVSFKDGTADFSGLIVELGNLGEHVLIDDPQPTSLDGTDEGGSAIVRALFDFGVITGDPGWVDFTYYVVAGEGEDNALLAWNQNPVVDGAPGFPNAPSAPIRPEHIIRPENFRITEEIVPDPTIEADLAIFRDDDEDSTRMPMVVFEVDPLTGRSDTLGIEKLDPDQSGREVPEQVGILDVSGVHILLDYITAEPEPGFAVDLLEGSVDEVVGDPVFHFRVPDPGSPLNDPAVWSQVWDTSQFTTTGVISFLGLAGSTTTIPEPSTLLLLLLGAGTGLGCVRRRQGVRASSQTG